MTDREKIHSGKVYYPSGDEIMTEQLSYLDKLYDFNMTRPTELDKREKMLKEIAEKNLDVITIEDNIINGGFGSYAAINLIQYGFKNKIKLLGYEDFIPQGDVKSLYKDSNLDKEGIVAEVLKLTKGDK
mgnify:CR=1 FL=1